jgi:carboxyl-terminal processing protease
VTRTLVYGAAIVLLAAVVAAAVLTDPLYLSLAVMTRATALVSQRALLAGSAEELKYSTIAGLVSPLDDYSTWHDRVADTTLRREARGHYGGFGIEIVGFGDTTVVWQVFPETPAAAAGLQLGDRLLAADTVSLVGLPLDSVHAVLATLPLDTVPLTVFRPGAAAPQVIRSARGDIEVGTVQVVDRRDTVALIQIGSFNGRTAPALRRAIDTLKATGTRAFILDLRGNPGGLLTSAVACAELFMPRAGLITSVTGVRPNERINGHRGPFPDEPLVILVDAHSASGSELMSGCLQDWDRAVLVGTPTFGKGLVQNLYGLFDGSSLRLTVGRYHTPAGRTFFRPDSTRPVDTTHIPSLVSGRLIPAGGQIFPDVEVASPDCPAYLDELVRGRLPFDFAVDLFARDVTPQWGPGLIDRFFAEYDTDRLVGQLGARLDSLAPVRLRKDPSWQRALVRLHTLERRHDRDLASDCLLLAVAHHLRRAGREVPLLGPRLLELDPALAAALDVLRRPGRYRSILTGAAS